MSATLQFGTKIVPNLAPFKQHLKPDDGRKRIHDVNKTTLPSHKVPKIMRANAKKAHICSESLIEIKLLGLAAPPKAL